MQETRPLIQLLRSPKGYYFFETNRNEIVQIGRDAFEVLCHVMQDNSVDSHRWMAHPELVQIRELGYLSTHRPIEIRHGMTDSLEDLLTNNIERITLQLTQECNFRCRYCGYSNMLDTSQRTHANVSMTWETAKKAVDFYRDHSQFSQRANIGFYGGEPLLAFGLLKKVVAYAKECFRGRELSYSLTTNGSILTDDVIEFFIENDISVLISVDGPREVHDANRVFAQTGTGTFDYIVENLQRAREKYPNFVEKIRINMVVDPKNDLDCANKLFMDYDVFDHERTMANYVSDTFAEGDFHVREDFVIKNEYARFLAFLNRFNLVDRSAISPLALGAVDSVVEGMEKILPIQSLANTIAPGGPCLPGVLRAMVDVHGNIFPCERCSETASAMCIGSLDKGFDIENAKKLLNIGMIAQEHCKNCWAIGRCKLCAARIAEGDNLSEKKKLSSCEDTRWQVEQELLDAIALRELSQSCQEKGELT